jgi:hypothetical protein
MKDDDPRRFLDPRSNAPDLVRRALESARIQGPSASDLARLATRLPTSGGGGGAPPATPPLLPPPVPSVISGVIVGAVLGVATLGVGFGLQSSGAEPLDRSPRPILTTAQIAETRPIPPIPSAPVTPVRVPRPAPSSSDAAPPLNASAGAIPSAMADVPFAPNVDVVGGIPGAAGDGETEVHLLERARVDLSTTPAHALALTEEDAARFPAGGLRQERDLLAIEALQKLGRNAAAQERAAHFVAMFPGSAHRQRIEALVGPMTNPSKE